MNDAPHLPHTLPPANAIHTTMTQPLRLPTVTDDEARSDAGLSKAQSLAANCATNVAQPQPPDPDEAARFLAMLGESHTFQTFDDGPEKNRRRARIFHGGFAKHAGALARLNANGAGVFVTVNETDSKGRKAENIRAVRAVFVDLDGAPLEPVKACELAPHCVVESSSGRYHAYWRCDGLPLAEFKPIQQAIAALFNGDKSVCDLPRVMRLPGFNHRKRAPFRTRVLELRDEPPYTADEVHAAFQPAPAKTNATASKPARAPTQPVHAELLTPRTIATGLHPFVAEIPDGAPVSDEVLSDLCHALDHIPADDRETWIRMGHALKAGVTNGWGFDLWRYWSRKSPKCVEDDLFPRWQGFDPKNTGHKAVFAEAQRCGWQNPRSGADGYRVFDEPTKVEGHPLLKPGVWQLGLKKKGRNYVPHATRICSPLHIEAVTDDGSGNAFGRLLRFRNTNGTWREWAMPMQMLAGRGDELRAELLSQGVEIDPDGHTELMRYLQADRPARRVRCVAQTGWSGAEFVMPDGAIGPNPEGVALQTGVRVSDEFTCAGTLDEWKAGIAARAEGNPMLTLALSAAFAGPLLAKVNAEGGGLHFVGDSSTGKTSALEAACSVWGGPGYKRSWRATANGMEGAAAMFNDCLLTLDEISECDPREVGAIVYALGNGTGKQRAARTGAARSVTRWRCFVISSGERTIETAMAEGGNRAKAGQGVRLLNVEVARTFGAWDNLHGLADGAAFSDAIKTTAAACYGHGGREFLRRLTADNPDLLAQWQAIKAQRAFASTEGEGQDERGATRFALVALAGELATSYGLTGWPEGEATRAAAEALRMWRGDRGKGNDERRQVCEMVSDFITRHGDARFSSEDFPCSGITVHNRAGWIRGAGEDVVYLFISTALREALSGFDLKRALKLLAGVGALPPPNARGEHSRSERIMGRVLRLYPIKASALELLP